MMSRSILFFSVALLLFGCRKDPPVPPVIVGEDQGEGWVRLKFVPQWEGGPFVPFTELQNISGYRVQVEKVQFYVSDLRLTTSTRTSDLLEVMFIDLIDGPRDTLLKMSTGAWTELSFGLGVSEVLNHSDPVLYANDHPLSSANGMHWDWAMGYIFTKFEGRHDVTSGSSGPFPSTFSIHTGFDTAYVNVDLPSLATVNVLKDDTITLNVNVAIDRFFHTAGDTIDLATEYMSHGTNVPLSLELARNVSAAFSID